MFAKQNDVFQPGYTFENEQFFEQTKWYLLKLNESISAAVQTSLLTPPT